MCGSNVMVNWSVALCFRDPTFRSQPRNWVSWAILFSSLPPENCWN